MDVTANPNVYVPEPLRIAQERLDDAAMCLRVYGDLTNREAPLLREAIQSLDPCQLLVIDLTDCPFVDSSNIGVLIAARSRVAANGQFALVVPPGDILHSLQVARLDRLFRIFESRDALLNSQLPA